MWGQRAAGRLSVHRAGAHLDAALRMFSWQSLGGPSPPTGSPLSPPGGRVQPGTARPSDGLRRLGVLGFCLTWLCFSSWELSMK